MVVPKPQDWERVVTEVLKLPDLLANPNPRLTRLLTILRTRSSGTIRAPVHCECALVAHYQNRLKSIPNVAPLEHIRASCHAELAHYSWRSQIHLLPHGIVRAAPTKNGISRGRVNAARKRNQELAAASMPARRGRPPKTREARASASVPPQRPQALSSGEID